MTNTQNKDKVRPLSQIPQQHTKLDAENSNNPLDILIGITPTKPTKNVLTTTKASNTAFKQNELWEDGKLGADLNVGNRKNKSKQYITSLDIEFPNVNLQAGDGIQITSSKDLNPLDWEIHDTISECYMDAVKSGKERATITFSQIASHISGANRVRNTAELYRYVENSIDKMMQGLITLDYTEHAKMKGLDLDSCKFKQNIISIKYASFEQNGYVNAGIEVLDCPPLRRYAEDVGQLTTSDFRKQLEYDTTVTNVVLVSTIHRRIEALKNKNNHISNTMLIDDLLKTAYISIGMVDKITAKKRSKALDHIESILKQAKEIEYIKSYHFITKDKKAFKKREKGKSVYGIVINV